MAIRPVSAPIKHLAGLTVAEESGFLSRWSRRKTALVQGTPPLKPVSKTAVFAEEGAGIAKTASSSLLSAGDSPESLNPAAVDPVGQRPMVATSSRPGDLSDGQLGADKSTAMPQLSLEDTRLLTKDSDFKPFMAHDVSATVRNAAMKKLFADPHFNVMDGLDTYIDDYSKFVPLTEAVLRQMNGAKFLNLFSEEEKTDENTGAAHVGVSDFQGAGHEPVPESSLHSAALDDAAGSDGTSSRENLNNLTSQTVAQSSEQQDIAAFALVVPIIPCQPGLAINPEASQQDHADTDLRLQPDHAATAPGAGRGAK